MNTDLCLPPGMLSTIAARKGLYIGGEWQATGSAGTYRHVSAITGQVQAQVPLAGAAEIDHAVALARAAAPAWRGFDPGERGKLLMRLADLVVEEGETLAALLTVDTGLPISISRSIGPLMESWIRYYAGWCDKIEGQSLNHAPGGRWNVSREPYGVVGIILTWNMPASSVCMKAMAALAAGNTIVVKSPEMSPFGMMFFAELFERAGFPKGVVSVLPGGAAAGAALVAHPGIGKLSFTGGSRTAEQIIAASARNITPVLLELGGKSASIVFEDADLKRAIPFSAHFAMAAAGQACIVPSRLLVHESVYDEAVAMAQGVAESMKVGDPFDPATQLGPVINEVASERILRMIDKGRQGGCGRLLTGGRRVGGRFARGYFIEPTIFADVPVASSLFQDEIFGPVQVISRFSSEEEAIALANGTRFGLYGYLFTRDIARAMRVADRMEAGSVAINNFTGLSPRAPFGGYGISGFGKEGGRAGLEEFLRSKTIFIAD
jgi:aldehyde dehydrogenase (NAD+)